MAHLQNAVAHRDARQRDEADQRRHRQRLARHPQPQHRAHQRQRDVGHDEGREHGRAVARVQHHEHQHQRDDGQHAHQAAGFFLRLELAAQGDEVALGQARFSHGLADVGHHVGQRPALRVGRQHDAALAIVAADLVGAVALFDGGQARQGHGAAWCVDQHARQAVDGACAVGQAHHQCKAAAAFHHLGDFFALHQRLQRGQHLGGGHAHLCSGGVVHAHGDLRRQHLLFHLQVGQAGDGRQPRAQGFRLAPQRVQVVAKELDGNLRAHARQHVVDAVRDGLAQRNGGGQVHQAAADVGLHLGHAALELRGGQQAHVQLTHVHAFGMFVQLGAAAAPAHVRDLGHLAH